MKKYFVVPGSGEEPFRKTGNVAAQRGKEREREERFYNFSENSSFFLLARNLHTFISTRQEI
jgi:hypothetical protein